MRPVSVGSRRRQTFSPSPDDTAGAIGNLGIDAVATITLIRYIETVSYELVRPYYEDGEATVGTRVDVEHVAPASPAARSTSLAPLSRCADDASASRWMWNRTGNKSCGAVTAVPSWHWTGSADSRPMTRFGACQARAGIGHLSAESRTGLSRRLRQRIIHIWIASICPSSLVRRGLLSGHDSAGTSR